MTRRKLDEENIRSLMKIGASYAVTIPMEYVQKLKWKEKQKVEVNLHQDRIIIKDWKKGS
jgi:antitoxin component of MazEF toxin-antitoxin module